MIDRLKSTTEAYKLSLNGLYHMGRLAAAKLITNASEFIDRVDTKAANAPNTPEDEL